MGVLVTEWLRWRRMPRDKEVPPEKLEQSRDARIAARLLDQHENYVNLLRQAARIRSDGGFPDAPRLATLIQAGDTELRTLRRKTGGRIYGRRRPTGRKGGPRCTVFLDECGGPTLTSPEIYRAFVLAAVIIRDQDYEAIDRRWKAWKLTNFGSADHFIHEPEVRNKTGFFNQQPESMFSSLSAEIASLDFAAVVCVLHRPEYIARYGLQALDNSLPAHPYLMALDFVMERVVMVLDSQFNGSIQAVVRAESRGPLEDALLEYEFARLHLDGTSYIAGAWFRQQLQPGVRFESKDTNSTGLQLADLLARPCGDKVLDPASTPERWPEFRSKLCPGRETKHSILGIKIVPWDEKYEDLWKS